MPGTFGRTRPSTSKCLIALVASVAAASCAGTSAAGNATSTRPAIVTSTPIRQGTDLVKTAGTVVAIDADRLWLRITDRNEGAQAVWNDKTVAAVATARTVFPGLGVSRLADAHLTAGTTVTFTFVPLQYDEQLGAYPALVIGREQR